MNIIVYNQLFKNDFVDMNKNWILKDYRLTDKDIEIFMHPEIYCNRGSEIFLCLENKRILASTMVYVDTNCSTLMYMTELESGHDYLKNTILKAISFAKTKNDVIYLYLNDQLFDRIDLVKELGFTFLKNVGGRDNLQFIYKGSEADE